MLDFCNLPLKICYSIVKHFALTIRLYISIFISLPHRILYRFLSIFYVFFFIFAFFSPERRDLHVFICLFIIMIAYYPLLFVAPALMSFFFGIFFLFIVSQSCVFFCTIKIMQCAWCMLLLL